MVGRIQADDPNRPTCCGKPMAQDKGCTKSGRRRYRCGGKNGCGKSTTGSPESEQPLHREEFKLGYDPEHAEKYHTYLKNKIKKGLKRIVVTSAQDTTPKHSKFLESLLMYCEYHGAELVIIPVHYKNVSLYTGGQKYDKSWDKSLNKYLIDKPLKIGGVTIRADIKVSATMLNPLTGKEPISGNAWTIFGHPQFAMETVCDMKQPKRMYTTGSITQRNYSRTNAGAKSEFHHVHGALVVEIGDKKPFVRQLNADKNGEFYDLDGYYTPDAVYESDSVLGLITGDEHEKFHSKTVRKATYDNPDSIVNTLRPKNIIRHDILDGYAGSHHHEKDDVLQFRKHHKGDNNYKKEVESVIKYLNDTTPDFSRCVFPASNHQDHLYLWLSRVDPKIDHTNALFIHELKSLQYENAMKGGLFDQYDVDPFRLYASPRLAFKFKFLRRSEQFLLAGVDVGQHGDVGPNGSRGNARSLAKGTHKMVIGHSHSARIVRGVYQVGTSTGRLEYQRGLSSWTNTHCVIYPNGKRTMIDIFNGKWRA